MWFREIFLVVVLGLDGREVVGITNEDVGKRIKTTAEVPAIQIVAWVTLATVERKRKWMDAVDIVKIESRKLADNQL